MCGPGPKKPFCSVIRRLSAFSEKSLSFSQCEASNPPDKQAANQRKNQPTPAQQAKRRSLSHSRAGFLIAWSFAWASLSLSIYYYSGR